MSWRIWIQQQPNTSVCIHWHQLLWTLTISTRYLSWVYWAKLTLIIHLKEMNSTALWKNGWIGKLFSLWMTLPLIFTYLGAKTGLWGKRLSGDFNYFYLTFLLYLEYTVSCIKWSDQPHLSQIQTKLSCQSLVIFVW